MPKREFTDEVRNGLLMSDWQEIAAELERLVTFDDGSNLVRTIEWSCDLATINEAIRLGPDKVCRDPDKYDIVVDITCTYATPEMIARETPEFPGLIGRARQLGLID